MRGFILVLAEMPLFLGVAWSASGDGRGFDQKLSSNQQIVHVLNRLTFGPLPGDADEVRRLGIEKWIDRQLHPERIPENPALEDKLKPFETLRMSAEQILKDYPLMAPGLAFRQPPLSELLSPDQVRRVLNGTAEERVAVLDSLDAAKRKQVLTVLAPPLLASIPAIQKEADAARQAMQEERAKEMRRVMPPLNDLLNPDQMAAALRGNPEQLRELFAYLDPDKRRQVAGALPPQVLAAFPEMRREGMKARQPQQVLTDDLRQGKVLRALYSNRQLEEVLVDFWFNHFNVQEGKTNVRPLVASYERDAIRQHVLGHFKDLLLATAQHPAMLYYLDNWESIAPGALDIGPFSGPPQIFAQQLSRQAHGLNENYGREIMELHTLGVEGGYTQQDVIAVARCFTGWTIRQPNTRPEFVFASFMHDTGEKTVLGHKMAAGGGIEDGLQVIDILAHHPATARYISKELAQRFVADDPPKALVDRMAQTFTKTEGDLRAVLQAMFSSSEFLSEGAWQAKLKSPLEWVVSAVRAMGGSASDAYTLAQRISDLGEPLYAKVEPSGYLNNGDGWLNTANLLGRMNFANSLASGQIPGVTVDGARLDGKDVATVAQELLLREPALQTREALDKRLGQEATGRFVAGLVLSSPDFQRR